MENKKTIPIITLAILSMSLLLVTDLYTIPNAYALTISSFSITGSPNFFYKVGNVAFTLNTSTGSFHSINLLTGAEVSSATLDTTGTSFRGWRCNASDCWQMRTTSTTDCYLTRVSSSGVQEEQIHYTNDCSGSSDIGIFSSTIFFGRKCTTGDIGSAGAGDTDLAIFSVDGNSMAGTPVQHTDCGSNFTPISSSNQGLIGYKATTIAGNSRLAVITNGAVGAADIFTYINLEQSLTSLTNTQLCQVTMTSSNAFATFQGRNIQFTGNNAYVNVNSGTDSFLIHTITSTCGRTATGNIGSFETGTANMALDTTRDILYLGGIEADATGLLIIGYNFTSDTATTSALVNVTPDSTVASATYNGFDYTSSIDTGYMITASKLYLIDFGGAEEPETPNEEFCADPDNAETLICRLEVIGGSSLGSASQSFANSTNDIFIQVGLVEEGSDIQTNGIGYMLVALGLALMIVMFYLGSGGELGKIPTFVWVLGALMVVGSMTGFGFVDSTFFIITILVIIALASAKIISALERF